MKDILVEKYGNRTPTINCLDHGFVKLVDCMPRLVEDAEESADHSIAEAARCSYQRGTKTINDDKMLIRYLMRHNHTSPFEMIEFKFHCKMPIFVARQMIRHRTACLSGDVSLYFDEPAAIHKGGRKRKSQKVKDIFRKWTEGSTSIFVHPTRNKNIEGIDPSKEYTVSELAKIIGQGDVGVRRTVRKNSLFCAKNPYKIKGETWISHVRKEMKWNVDCKKNIMKMNLRMLNESNGEIEHTHITDIWCNGEKEVFEVEFDNGYKIKTTKDHMYFTEKGWLTLDEATNMKVGHNVVTWEASAPSFFSNGMPCYQDYEWMKLRREKGCDVEMIAAEAGVSYHTIRKWLKRLDLRFSMVEKCRLSGLKQRGRKKTFTKPRSPLSEKALENIRKARSGYMSNFWKGGVSSDRENVGRWTTDHSQIIFKKYDYKCVICGSNKKLNAHHVDPVWNNPSLSRDIDNLVCLCSSCHSNIHKKNLELNFMRDFYNKKEISLYADENILGEKRDIKKRKPRVYKLISKKIKIRSIKFIGLETVYDVSVSGPYHNFIANGLVVHNSVNELSGRYSEIPEEVYVPDINNMRTQSSINNQGSEGFIVQEEAIEYHSAMQDCFSKDFELYHDFLESGLVREQSRMVLPLSTYTEWYWKIDLKNLLHFLNLRCDSHAQQEIRVYGDAILDLIKPIVPWTIEAWEDYSPYRGGMMLTRYEVDKIRHMLNFLSVSADPESLTIPTRSIKTGSRSENKEWLVKAEELGFNHGSFTKDEV